MRVYLVNLDRRPDRRATMEAMAARLGLHIIRIPAVDAASAPTAQIDRLFAASGPLGEIPPGDKCCLLSHRLFWEQLVASGEDYATVLEDDAVLTASAPKFLTDASWIPPGVDLVKPEHYGPKGQRILVSGRTAVAPGFELARLRSRHTGTGGYIISRRAAQRLLAIKQFHLPVDHLLFNPNNSPEFSWLAPQQLIPAVLRQQDFIGEKSDIEAFRKGFRKFDVTYVKREMVRFGYDLRLVPQQLALALSGRAKLVEIRTE
jgi:glycosyl transferase family 25